MAIDHRIGKKVDPNLVRENAAGVRFDSGPFIGLVKNNLDPTRSGRLQVWIPDLGAGDESNPVNWRTVSYASPFFGSTVQGSSNATGPRENSFDRVRHTYGMWFTVPDLENFVLCTFVAGDPNRGFWFACVPNQLGHHMVPAVSSSRNIDSSTIKDAKLRRIVKPNSVLPVAEFNEFNAPDFSQFVQAPKPIHEYQANRLVTQGLDRINLTGSRGIIFSSSQRETPSGVFGVSTPGRTVAKQEDRVQTRAGGHSLVMDDGDLAGINNLVRLRTAAGHQILMDDSERILYISNSEGSCWIEMTGSGHVNVYGAASINLRAGRDLNLHADGDVNINAGGSMNLSSKQSTTVNSSGTLNLTSTGQTSLYGGIIKIGSDGRLDLYTPAAGSFTATQSLMFTGKPIGLNSGPGPTVSRPKPSPIYNIADTRIDGNGQWQVQHNVIKSVSKIVPTHEPWPRTEGVASSASGGSSSIAETGTGTGTGTGSAAESAAGNLNISSSSGSSILASGSAAGASITAGSPPTANIAVIDCGATLQSQSGTVRDSSGNPILTGSAANLDPGPKAAVAQNVSNPVPVNYLKRDDAPNPPGGIGPLTQIHVKGIMTQLGYSESTFQYTRVNQLGYAGKYQFGASALVDTLYIKLAATNVYKGNRAMNYPTSWTGRNGVNSQSDWLNNKQAQESAMYELLTKSYGFLSANGGIKNGDDLCTVAGMLCVSHLLGPTGSINWRKTAQGADANGTSGIVYFNRGRYVIDVLVRGG